MTAEMLIVFLVGLSLFLIWNDQKETKKPSGDSLKDLSAYYHGWEDSKK